MSRLPRPVVPLLALLCLVAALPARADGGGEAAAEARAQPEETGKAAAASKPAAATRPSAEPAPPPQRGTQPVTVQPAGAATAAAAASRRTGAPPRGGVAATPASAAPVPGSVVRPVRPQRFEVGDNGVIEVGTASAPVSRWRGAPISMSLRDAPLPEVLRTFAKVAGVNLVLDPRVQGLVTVELENVPWDQALYVILKTHGMGAEIDGRVWLVTPN